MKWSFLFCVFLFGCGEQIARPQTERWFISPYLSTCRLGFEPDGPCLVNAKTLQPFTHRLTGFEFVWGHSYEVAVESVPGEANSESDGTTYVVSEIVSDIQADPGVEFESALSNEEPFRTVALSGTEGTIFSGGLQKGFVCATAEVCDALAMAIQKQKHFSASFRFPDPTTAKLILHAIMY
jgi:hypothetical protein